MPTARGRLIAAVSVAVAVSLTATLALSINAHPLEKRSPSVTLAGISRSIRYAGEAYGNLSILPDSGCSRCPLVIEAGSSAVVPIWVGWANISVGLTAYFNWSLHSPFPFADIYCEPPIAAETYACNESNQAGPYGGGEFGFAITISVPYEYSALPSVGNLSFTMTATLVGHATPPP